MKVDTNLLTILSGKKVSQDKRNKNSNPQGSQKEITQVKKIRSFYFFSLSLITPKVKKFLALCMSYMLKLEKILKERIMQDTIKEFLKKNAKVMLAIVACFIFFGSILSLIYLDYRNNMGFVFEKRFVMLAKNRNSLDKYNTLQPDDLHIIWFNSLRGFTKNHTTIQAIAKVLNELGANIDGNDDSVMFVKRINAYIEVGLSPSSSAPKPGSLIIFRGTWYGKVQSHRIGIIEEVTGEYIKYMTWTPDLKTTYPVVRKGDPSILMISEMSYPIWSGVLLKNGIRITRGIGLFHDGVDMKISNFDRRVYAFEGGVVVKVFNKYNPKTRWTDWRNSGGNYCVIQSKIGGKTYLMRYLHLVNLKVRQGQKVAKNQLLGQYADVGYSFGAHLHLDMHDLAHNRVDPLPFLNDYASFIIYGYEDERAYIATNMILDHIN